MNCIKFNTFIESPPQKKKKLKSLPSLIHYTEKLYTSLICYTEKLFTGYIALREDISAVQGNQS